MNKKKHIINKMKFNEIFFLKNSFVLFVFFVVKIIYL